MFCPKCNTDKNLNAFGKRGNKLQGYCKECKKIHIRQHYNQNKKYYIQKAKDRKFKIKEIIDKYKSENPCLDCKKYFPSIAMDFDHRDPKTKHNDVSKMLNLGNFDKIIKEIQKCDLVCACCHRIRTENKRIASISPLFPKQVKE